MTIKNSIIILAILTLLVTISCSNNTKNENNNMNKTKKTDSINISDINVKTIDGKEISLSDYRGKVLLIVNVASKCGYTKQYTGLQALYDKYKSKGFEILGFPCNDFGGQEPGTNEEIKDFCSLNYNISFPLFDKIKVLGTDKSPLYEKLTMAEPEGDISWNFEKFIIDKSGNVVKRFKSKVKPEDAELTGVIEELL
jgi:glutathione peroxidase